MSRVQKPAVKKRTSLDYCHGSGVARQNYTGRKTRNGVTRYPCPVCCKHITCDFSGNFNKHGWTTYKTGKKAKSKRTITSYCAACDVKFEGLDFLCERCRDDPA